MAQSPQRVLQLLDKDLQAEFLEKFIERKTIPKETLEDFEALYSYLEKQPPFTDIEANLKEIRDMAGDEATERFLTLAKDLNVDFGDGFEKCTNGLNRAMWVWLNHFDLFDEASLWNHLKDYGSEYKLQREELLTPEFFTNSKKEILKTEIQEYFKNERKGRECSVDLHENKKTNTVCLSVYFDDYSKSELAFKKSKLTKTYRKPVKDMHFLVLLSENKVALQFKRIRQKKKKELMKIFIEKVLDESFNAEDFKTLYLDDLFDRNFSLTAKTPAEDKLEYARIKSLRFEKRIGKHERIIVDAKDGDQKNDIYSLMDILKLKFSPEVWQISQATIHFQFKDQGRKGSVTTTLSLPNTDDLQDKPLHQKCRKYLTDLRIMR